MFDALSRWWARLTGQYTEVSFDRECATMKATMYYPDQTASEALKRMIAKNEEAGWKVVAVRGKPLPGMTPGQADEAMRKTQLQIYRYGLYATYCECGYRVAGKIAEDGPPTDYEMKYLACPECGASAPDGAKFTFKMETVD